MKLKKLLLLILILLLIFNVNSSFAFEVDYNGSTYDIPEFSDIVEYEYQCVIYTSSRYYLYDSNTPIYINVPSGSGYYNVLMTDTSKSAKRYEFYHDSSQNWELVVNYLNGEHITTGNNINLNFTGSPKIIYSNYDVLSNNGDIIHEGDSNEEFIFPYIANTDIDLTKGTNDYFLVLPGSVTSTSDITFSIYLESEPSEVLYSTVLNGDSEYYKSVVAGDVLEFWYEVPVSALDFEFSAGSSYVFNLSGIAKDEYSIGKKIDFKGLSQTDIYNGLNTNINNQTEKLQNSINQSTQEIQSGISLSTSEITNSIDKQTAIQEEQVETSKGIWGTLKEVLSYINPFSENFFVYKLIDLLIDALKSLFIPSDDFLNNYFDELMNWFSDRLGFLFYPLELILDVLNRIVNINFEEPIIQIPNIVEPSTNEKIISNTTYNLNSLLENNVFKTCHDVYFVLVDAVIVFGLVNLLKHKLEEVFTK